MSSDAGASLLDAALACIGQRISTILHLPGDKDENFISSLHNEVVSIPQCSHISVISQIQLGLSLLLCGLLAFGRLVAAPLFQSQSGLPFEVFQTLETPAAILPSMEAGCQETRPSHPTLPDLILQSGGNSENQRHQENSLMFVMR
jgi:hypothetical protein